MMDIIHLLPDAVANQIAAGEVIQRPASVIKELIENAIDAGASNINVVLEDAGRTLIQVVDDGKGMSDTDARLAFERHATSKIKKADDLFALKTMGFRGEALPSIAAVAHVKLTTRTIENELGTQVEIEGSRIVSQEPCACPVGANFEVRNLFFNVPARRKFLKSNQTELNNIIQEFERIALVNPSVAFTLHHNGSLVTQLPSAPLRMRISNIFGRKLNEQLLDIDVDTTLIHLKGFVGKPDSSKKKSCHQYFFVNGRFMRHPYFAKAIMEAYDQLIPTGEQIPYFLYFEVDPANIDVNIHPTKTEVKFENEQAIWQIIVAAIREVLGRFSAVPVLEFDTEGCPEIPVFQEHGNIAPPKLEINSNFNPFTKNSAPSPSKSANRWEALYPDVMTGSGLEGYEVTEITEEEPETLYASQEEETIEMSSEHIQLQGQYILTPVRSGMMIVNQQRAHIRILYDKYRAQMEGQPVSTQGLLFPEVVQFSIADALLLEEATDELKALGFELSPLGGGSFAVNGMPAGLEDIQPAVLLTNIVESIKDKST
ncbi:MAG: DNA mismatch repair endonuclease MutL, partial [Bacteroidaceae bacterium]|nr:DNA mismatch repair endonuclease MutL [Bacteroidaceae bacterium]